MWVYDEKKTRIEALNINAFEKKPTTFSASFEAWFMKVAKSDAFH